MRKHSTLFTLACLLAIQTIAAATDETVKLVKNIKPAVVLIQTFDANNSPLATGSGFFIDNKGSLITNHQVIEGAYSATVKTSAAKEYKVTGILAKDTEADIVKLSCGRVAWPEAQRGHGLVPDPNRRGDPMLSPSLVS